MKFPIARFAAFLLALSVALSQPTFGDTAVSSGQSITFSASALGTPPFTYQWNKDGAPIAGATSAKLVIASGVVGDSGSYTVTVANAAKAVTSGVEKLVVSAAATAPVINTAPTSVSVLEGASATLSVSASGSGTLTYQWKKNGTVIAGATSSSYTIAATVTGDAGDYTVTVSNSASSVTTSAATLTVTSTSVAPTITTQPTSVSTVAGSDVSFSVSATGSGTLSYQWKKGTTAISGATSATLTLSKVASGAAGNYSVTVSNSVGSIASVAATLTISASSTAPSITSNPAATIIDVGSPLSLSVGVGGTAPFTYQWRKGGINVLGATSSTFSVSSVSLSDAGSYSVVVTNSAGSATSGTALVTVNSIVTAPSISRHPASLVVTAGQNATFSVAADGTGPLTYQWVFNDADIPGATQSSLTLSAVNSASSGNYSVVVSNSAGSDVSAAASLTVNGSSTGGSIPTDGTPGDTGHSSTPTRLANLSIRTVSGKNGSTLTIGLTTTGTASEPVLVRAIGPALTQFGVAGVLADPRIGFYDSSNLVISNDNWGTSNADAIVSTAQAVGAFALVDRSSKDACVLTSLLGQRSVQVTSARGNESGIVLVEAYDAGPGIFGRFVNLSARNYVGTGADVLIVGFVIDGPGTRKLLIRAVGPSLSQFGVAGVLTDPVMQLHRVQNGEATLVESNDDWGGAGSLADDMSKAGAFPLDATSKDSAIVGTLSAGSYAITVSGKNGLTGEALVELYEAN